MPDLWGQTVSFGGVLLGDRIVINAKTKTGATEAPISFGGIVLNFDFPYVRPLGKTLSLTGPEIWYNVGVAGVVNENRLQLAILVANPTTYSEAINKFIDVCGQNAVDELIVEVSPATCANIGENRKKIVYKLSKPLLFAHNVQMRAENPPTLVVALGLTYSSLSVSVETLSQ